MLSRIAWVVSVLLLCYASFFYYPRWQKKGTEATISWDVSGYYWYLPAAFIYHDIRQFRFKDSILQKYRPTDADFQQAMRVDNGNYVIKYSSGMALMYLPFFAAGHLCAHALGYPADGFSAPYQFAIQFGGWLLSVIGLWYLRKLLLLFYRDNVVAITLLLIAIGSNYLNYASVDAGMSHTWLFTIYVLLLLNIVYWHRDFRPRHAAIMGLLIGLATLARPTEIISCLIPLLWGMEGLSVAGLKKQMRILVANRGQLLLAMLIAGAMLCTQVVYWKYVSGKWIVYSYGDQAFQWIHPHAYLYSFNYRSGWLTYSPIMILALAGLVIFARQKKNAVAVIGFFLLNYYIISSWDIWWFGGRAMVQSYAILAFPFAALTDYVIGRKVLKVLFAAMAAFFVYFNLWAFVQMHTGGLYDSYDMSRAYFWRVAGRWSAPESTKALLDAPDLYEGIPKDKKLLYANDFDTCTSADCIKWARGNAFRLSKSNRQVPPYTFPYAPRKNGWLRVTAVVSCSQQEWDHEKMPKMHLKVMNGSTTVKESILKLNRLVGDGQTKELSLDMKLPDQQFTDVSFTIWNDLSEHEVIVDDIRIWAFMP